MAARFSLAVRSLAQSAASGSLGSRLWLGYWLQKSWTNSPSDSTCGPKDQDLQAVGPGFESSRDARAHAYGIERGELHELVVELDAAVAVDDDVDLLGGAVAMSEGLALAGLDDEEVHPGLLGAKVLLGEASFLVGREPVLGR
jgi:hypothetical protein